MSGSFGVEGCKGIVKEKNARVEGIRVLVGGGPQGVEGRKWGQIGGGRE